MSSLVLYFQVHQPLRTRPYPLFEIGKSHNYFDSPANHTNNNAEILKKVADHCYLPTNQALLSYLRKNPDAGITFAISGVALDQFEAYAPEVLESFKALADTGQVEFLAETYYHSLSSVFSQEEFVAQIELHHKKTQALFGVTPVSFRNTELIYSDEIAAVASGLGYRTILAEGIDRYLGWRSANYVYQPPKLQKLRLLMKNYRLADDIAFRFGDFQANKQPLKAAQFLKKLQATGGDVVNLFMDYETFGEHHWQSSGIVEFLISLLSAASKQAIEVDTVTDAAYKYQVKDTISIPNPTSWADQQRDLSAWTGNQLQQTALKELYSLETKVKQTNNLELLSDWRNLTTSDHFYYMSLKTDADGQVHRYFSPFRSGFEAFVNYMHILHDLRLRV